MDRAIDDQMAKTQSLQQQQPQQTGLQAQKAAFDVKKPEPQSTKTQGEAKTFEVPVRAPEKQFVTPGQPVNIIEKKRQTVSVGQQMTEQSEKPEKVLVSHGQQMTTEQSEHPQAVQKDLSKENANYNSKKGFLRGEATMEPVATTHSNVDVTQSVVNEQTAPLSDKSIDQ